MNIHELALACGMTEKEWNHLLEKLGREPSVTEVQMIGVMWSEHCSYKSSKRFLKKLISKGPQVLEGPGENAGLVALDEKRALAFKVESHNHPSFVEPFQGAATGVGGILRDIFTMGARPIATGNYLRFGNLQSEKHQFLLEGVVGGIAHYGNCMGIPTVGGHISSHACYDGNILVNVFAMGIVDRDKIYRASTARAGESVMVWGAKTGRDGIHGASLLASRDFETDTESTEQKIRVQVGDPFKEKVLMEATLECMEKLRDDLSCIQDMGAAGLTCSTMEISFKSNIGMTIDLEKVPVREDRMLAFELMLSESQERMLAIVKKGSEKKFQDILHRWGCEAEVIGETTSTGRLHIRYQGEEVVSLPVAEVMDPPPADLPEPDARFESLDDFKNPEIDTAIEDVKKEWEVLERLLAHPAVANKKAVFRRYDSTVGVRTLFGPGHEAAVLSVGSDENPHQAVAFKGVAEENLYRLHPRFGAQSAMARTARSLALVGAKPYAYTDGMNIGNPQRERTQTALLTSVLGFNDAAEKFNTPCIGGNVSLYNQTVIDEKPSDIFPTNFVVMVGLMDDIRKATPSAFQKSGNEVWLLEAPEVKDELPVGSLYARLFWNEEVRGLPGLDLDSEKRLQAALLEAHRKEMFASTRDVSQGGLAVSLAKGCLYAKDQLGFDGDLSKTSSRRDLLLFGEGHGRAIVEVSAEKRSELMKLGLDHGLLVKRLGSITADDVFRLRPSLNGTVTALRTQFNSVFQ